MGESNKRIIQAVAGSGKTTYLINELENEQEQIAIITYTENNQIVLKNKILDKFDGRLPDNVHLFGFWQFIYGFCVAPFMSTRPKGINFEHLKNTSYNQKMYTDNYGRFYKDRLSKTVLDKKEYIQYQKRIDKYFSKIFIDEVQDFGSDDLDWLLSLVKCEAEILCVGDFYQSTFQTSSRGNKNVGIKRDYDKYRKKFLSAGFTFDEMTLSKSFRCTAGICDFIRKSLNINILSNSNVETPPLVLDDEIEIFRIWNDNSITKLFYSKSTDYDCKESMDWGTAKGITRTHVCVVLTQALVRMMKNNDFSEISPTTKAKFYVACTRARQNVYFIAPDKVKKHKK